MTIRRLLPRSTASREVRGQVLVIVAAGMVVFLGFAALVTDVGIAYAEQKQQRNLTDTAALAGAQELGLGDARAPQAGDYNDARGLAMRSLVDQLVGTAEPVPSCPVGGAPSDPGSGVYGYSTDVRNCPILENGNDTGYSASVVSPSPLCVNCNDERSVMVELVRDDTPAFFARLFGRDGWTVRQTSVASINIKGLLAVMTLRPPAPGEPNKNDPDIFIGGGTTLRVPKGDIGSNTTVILENASAAILMNADGPGYKILHYDPTYTLTLPHKYVYPKLMEDPDYWIPSDVGVPSGQTYAATSNTVIPQIGTTCDTYKATVDSIYVHVGVKINEYKKQDVTCYTPGVYNSVERVQNKKVALLLPGVYFFNKGLSVDPGVDGGGFVLGGWEAGSEGVALVFNECDSTSNCPLVAKGKLALNAGSCYPQQEGPCDDGTAATPALFNGFPVQTEGVEPNEFPLTLLVRKEPVVDCTVQPFEASSACSAPLNSTLDIQGTMFLNGVTYAPTDNVKVTGGSGSAGYVGQIIAWTVKYSGGSTINQFFAAGDLIGTVALDAACTGAGAASMSDPLCNP